MTRWSDPACCAVRRGTLAAAMFCLLRFASASSLLGVSTISGFVVLLGLSLGQSRARLMFQNSRLSGISIDPMPSMGYKARKKSRKECGAGDDF